MIRREFLAVAAALPVTVSSSAPAMMPIVDTHQHLWDLTKFTLPWVKGPLAAQHTSKEYAVATAGLDIVKAVYMEVGMAVDDQQREADSVIELCKSKSTPTCAAVVAGNPAAAGFAKYASQFKDGPYVKGVRHMLHVDGVHAKSGLEPKFLKGLQLLGDLGLRFDLCIRAKELADVEKIVGACPGTRFILDHCGNPQANFSPADILAWKHGLEALAKHANVVCKVSGIVANGFVKGAWKADDLAPFVNVVLDAFGPDRVLFASDWPVCTRTATLAEWVHALQQIVAHRSDEAQRKLFHDNAVTFYGLA